MNRFFVNGGIMNVKKAKSSIDICQKDFLSLNPKTDYIINAKFVKDCLGKIGFCYYTKFDTFKLILNSKRVWVRNVPCMNDKREFLDKNLVKDKFHLLCFSNSDDEIIPMWYMYAGTSGDGVRIRFTPGALRSLLKEIKVYRPDGSLLENYEISCGWIYYKYDESYYEHRNKKYSIDDWDESFNTNNLFIKSKHWNYEKEFRIVIENKEDTVYKHLEIDLSDIIDKLQFMKGPEFDVDSLSNDDKNLINKISLKSSELDIKMGL